MLSTSLNKRVGERMIRMFWLLIGIMLFLPTHVSAEKVLLRYHSFLPMLHSSNSKFVGPWAEKLAKESNGELKIEMYPSMQLGGKPPQLIDQVRDGVVDIIWTVAGYTPGRFPRLEVFDLPFMPSTALVTSQASHEFSETFGKEDLHEYKVLAVHVHAPGTIHTKNDLIKSIRDFKGLKLRGPTRTITKMLAGLGATPVGMPVPQVAPSLSKGVIDGMVVPWEVMPSFKLHELTKNHTEVNGNRGLYTTPFLFLMNRNRYESLSSEHRAIIDNNSGIELARIAGQLWDDIEIPARQLALEAGGEFFELSGEQLKQIRLVGDKMTSDWISEANENGLNGKELVEAAQNLIKKYEN